MRLVRAALAAWKLPAAMLDAVPGYQRDEPPDEQARRVDAWLAQWPDAPAADFLGTPAEWDAARSALQSRRRRLAVIADQLLVTARAKLPAEFDDAITEDDDSSFRRAEVTLAAHSTHVRDLAERYARALGFEDALVRDLTRWWGLAWLEAVIRLADHRASERETGGAS